MLLQSVELLTYSHLLLQSVELLTYSRLLLQSVELLTYSQLLLKMLKEASLLVLALCSVVTFANFIVLDVSPGDSSCSPENAEVSVMIQVSTSTS